MNRNLVYINNVLLQSRKLTVANMLHQEKYSIKYSISDSLTIFYPIQTVIWNIMFISRCATFYKEH